MNPRHRRLLIPGLLIALLVVVVVAALTDRAGAAETSPACVMSDERIDEQSGLAVSATIPDTAYVINDSGGDDEIFTIDTTTCEVIAVTRVRSDAWKDSEALALDGEGTLWVADTGDNLAQRDTVALYAVPEPGRDGGTVTATKHTLTHQGGATDVEALLIDPATGAKWLVTKGWVGGEFLAVPTDLSGVDPAVTEPIGVDAPMLVTDASMSPDGRFAVVRTYLKGYVYDVADDFAEVAEIALPTQQQGETIAVEPGGTTALVGSEGADQPLHRVALDLPEPDEDTTDESGVEDVATDRAFDVPSWAPVAGVVTLAAALGSGLLLGRRRRRP